MAHRNFRDHEGRQGKGGGDGSVGGVHASADPPGWVTRLRATRTGSALWDAPWHMLLLGAWAARWFPVLAARGGVSWHFFAGAGSLFVGGHPARAGGKPGGLHIYASYPKYQFGPVTLIFSAVARLLGSHEGLVAAQVLMTVCGLAVLYLLEHTARLVRPDLGRDQIRWTVLGAGLVFVPVWMILSVRFAPLDDVLALLFA